MTCDDPRPNQAPGRGNNWFVVERVCYGAAVPGSTGARPGVARVGDLQKTCK
jgi:hypothetical protein